MGRSWFNFKDQEVQNFGSGFKGLNKPGNRGDLAMRYDFGDKKLNTYTAVWNHTGTGGEGGWDLSVIEWIGNYEYSKGGELISHSHERITTKTYSYFPSVGVDREYAYSMVFEPKWNPPVALSGNHSEKNVTYYDSYYRTDGDHQPGIDEWRKQNPLVEIRDVYDPNTRHILVSSEEGFKTGFEDGWWNDVALKLNLKSLASLRACHSIPEIECC